MKTIEAFQTDDGQLFNDRRAAERHEELLRSRSVIDDFIDSDINPYKSIPQRAIVRNTIINWSLWNTKRGTNDSV